MTAGPEAGDDPDPALAKARRIRDRFLQAAVGGTDPADPDTDPVAPDPVLAGALRIRNNFMQALSARNRNQPPGDDEDRERERSGLLWRRPRDRDMER